MFKRISTKLSIKNKSRHCISNTNKIQKNSGIEGFEDMVFPSAELRNNDLSRSRIGSFDFDWKLKFFFIYPHNL